jgi:hypothetical protein
LYLIVLEQSDIHITGKLAAQVTIKNLRLAMNSYGIFYDLSAPVFAALLKIID